MKLWNKIPESIRNGTTKEKWEYFWEYYKLHMIVIVFCLLFVSSLVYHRLTEKEILLNGIFLNAVSNKSTVEELKNDMIREKFVDASKNDIRFDANLTYSLNLESTDVSYNYEASQAIVTQTVGGDLDFLIGDLPVMTLVSYSDYFLDLSEVLDAEHIELYESDFLYVDKVVLEEILESKLKTEDMIQIQKCTEPEKMENPIPVMINMSNCELIQEIYEDTKEPIVIGCIINSSNVDRVIKFIDYLYEKPVI